MQTIDSIKPPHPRSTPPNPAEPPHPRRAGTGRSIDGVRLSAKPGRPPVPDTKPVGTGARFAAFTRQRRRHVPWGIVVPLVASPLLFLAAMLGGIGEVMAVLYGIVALTLRLPSKSTFILSLAALLSIIILELAGADDIAQAMAVLAYILLAVGVMALAVESRRDNRLWFRKGKK